MKENEIRPKDVFEEYLRLASIDAEIYFGHSERHHIDCPACEKPGQYVFSKHGFSYEECPSCNTLYVSPRPPASDFFSYYQESQSARYFATTFYKKTADARRIKLWAPKAKMVNETLTRLGVNDHSIYDIGGGYGIFAEEYNKISDVQIVIIEPGPELANICRQKGLDVIESFLENIDSAQMIGAPKVFVSFELFEHLHDTNVFLKQLYKLMQPGDVFLFTTLSGLGVDIQSMWENSNSISLQHLNFFNPKSIRLLLKRIGFRVLTVETPGKLDVDILENNRPLIQDRFWRNFVLHASEDEKQVWQKMISATGFSSHMLVICERS